MAHLVLWITTRDPFCIRERFGPRHMLDCSSIYLLARRFHSVCVLELRSAGSREKGGSGASRSPEIDIQDVDYIAVALGQGFACSTVITRCHKARSRSAEGSDEALQLYNVHTRRREYAYVSHYDVAGPPPPFQAQPSQPSQTQHYSQQPKRMRGVRGVCPTRNSRCGVPRHDRYETSIASGGGGGGASARGRAPCAGAHYRTGWHLGIVFGAPRRAWSAAV